MRQFLRRLLQRLFQHFPVPNHPGRPAHAPGCTLPDFVYIGFPAEPGRQIHTPLCLLQAERPIFLRQLSVCPVSDTDNIFSRPLGARLTGIERTSARSCHTVAAADLSHCENPFYIGLPAAVRRQPSVIMLNTNGNFQHFPSQIHSMLQIK